VKIASFLSDEFLDNELLLDFYDPVDSQLILRLLYDSLNLALSKVQLCKGL